MLHHLHNNVDYNYQKLFFHLISVNFKKATSLERQRICRKTKNVITPRKGFGLGLNQNIFLFIMVTLVRFLGPVCVVRESSVSVSRTDLDSSPWPAV